MITHYIQYKHKEIMVPIFKSLVRPILEYGNAVWEHCLINSYKKIKNNSYWKYAKTLYQTYCWHEQPGVWTMTDGTKIIKPGIQKSKRWYDWNFLNYTRLLWSWDCVFLVQAEWITGTRVHPLKLDKTFLTNQYANCFTNRVINNWNSLPHNIVLAGTLNSF